MKIAIEGAQCTGKTTLATMLAERLGWERMGEMARYAHACGLKLNEEADYDTQRFIVRYQILEEIERMDKDLVCDRSTLSAVAHSALLWEKGKLTDDEMGRLGEMGMAWGYSYNLVVLTDPADCTMVADGVRSTDEEYRNRIHNFLVNALVSDYRHLAIMVSGTPEERVEQVMAAMKKMELIEERECE